MYILKNNRRVVMFCFFSKSLVFMPMTSHYTPKYPCFSPNGVIFTSKYFSGYVPVSIVFKNMYCLDCILLFHCALYYCFQWWILHKLQISINAWLILRKWEIVDLIFQETFYLFTKNCGTCLWGTIHSPS